MAHLVHAHSEGQFVASSCPKLADTYLTSHFAIIPMVPLHLASLSLKDDQFLYAILARLTQRVVCLCREVVTLGSRGLCEASTSRSSPVDSAGAVHVGADIFEAAGLHQGKDTCQDG